MLLVDSHAWRPAPPGAKPCLWRPPGRFQRRTKRNSNKLRHLSFLRQIKAFLHCVHFSTSFIAFCSDSAFLTIFFSSYRRLASADFEQSADGANRNRNQTGSANVHAVAAITCMHSQITVDLSLGALSWPVCALQLPLFDDSSDPAARGNYFFAAAL